MMKTQLDKYIDTVSLHYWKFLIVLPLIACFIAAFQLHKLTFDENWKIWYTTEALEQYNNFVAEFTYDDAVVIAFKDENGIFNKKAIETIQNLTRKLEQVRYVSSVESLTNFQYIRSDSKDKITIEDYISDSKNSADIAEKKRESLHNSELIHRLLSEDQKYTLIVARLSSELLYIDEDKSHEIKRDIDLILDEEQKHNGYDFAVFGGPEVTVSLEDVAVHDVAIFTPLMLIAIVCLLGLFFGTIHGVLLPLCVVLFTTIATLTFEVVLGHALNNFTVNIPLFIMAIGLADSIHIMSIYNSYLLKGYEKVKAIRETLHNNFWPLFLTSLTTGVGFMSLQFSEIEPTRYLGESIAFSVMFAFFLSVSFTPAYLVIIKSSPKVPINILSVFLIYLPDFIRTKYKLIIWSFGVLTVCFLCGIIFLKVDSNLIKYFDKSTEIRHTLSMVQNHITGPVTYEIVIKSGKNSGIHDPQFLKQADEFSVQLQNKYPEIKSVYSLLDIVKKLNRSMNEGGGSYYKVPENRKLISQYLFLYEMSLPEGSDIQELKNISESAIRMTANVNILGTSKDLEIINWIESWWEKSKFDVEVTGSYSLFAKMQNSVSNTLLYSLMMTLLLLVIILIPLLDKVYKWVVYLLPNILPIIYVFGIMGWFNIPIDLGIAISAAIILSISIDDSLHFLSKYFRATGGVHDSIKYAFEFAGKPMFYTTVIISLSFGLFAFSSFTPNIYFGVAVALGLILALLTDILLLPALLYCMDKEKI